MKQYHIFIEYCAVEVDNTVRFMNENLTFFAKRLDKANPLWELHRNIIILFFDDLLEIIVKRMLKTVIFGFITDIKCGWSLTKIITSQFAWNEDAWLFQRILAFDGRSQDCHSYFALCVIQVNPITVHFSTSMKSTK